MSSILNVIRQAPTPTRHFTSLQVVASSKVSSTSFNPEHHPIVLQQLVQSLSSSAYPSTAESQASDIFSQAASSSSSSSYSSSSAADALFAAARESLSEMDMPQQEFASAFARN
ncbi:hypothetical protein BGZ94_009190 [Podila epigama]|nr:hypothetical protein BGZ94_009190 [Podila epigama]